VRNPPILHRKETFLGPEHPLRAKFARLTAAAESKGLLEEGNQIGTRNQREQILTKRGFTLRGHRLVLRRWVLIPFSGSRSTMVYGNWIKSLQG
jgi:hypothetical protein